MSVHNVVLASDWNFTSPSDKFTVLIDTIALLPHCFNKECISCSSTQTNQQFNHRHKLGTTHSSKRIYI